MDKRNMDQAEREEDREERGAYLEMVAEKLGEIYEEKGPGALSLLQDSIRVVLRAYRKGVDPEQAAEEADLYLHGPEDGEDEPPVIVYLAKGQQLSDFWNKAR